MHKNYIPILFDATLAADKFSLYLSEILESLINMQLAEMI